MAGYSQQVKLQFMADTSQPQKQLQQLATQLKQIVEIDDLNFGVDKQIDKAVQSAKVLQKTLDQSMNIDTGKLDLNKFVTQLNKANLTVNQLASNLVQAGPIGEKAFRSLASSIAQAEVPVKKMNATLQGMLTSLANTVKWQISSSAVHGMMSGFSSAVGYVKDLNRSLNDIRIVTGQSVDDMARFAEQANKAAKALSTTTKAYTDASLIYYQQGDSQEMAAKKAALTIKAANASFGSSTKEMSEYLTAVWNSYQVGADELERYVDIMAALGAKTATSLEEIATSMQKVAATANTVGVSMEQVSSIISTVSSVTRESAESIGTSYKTIFARMGDLKLGGTDDGVGLGQVSSQLKSIGVQVLDATGNLRDMGDIITDLGNKWQTMSNAQKTATAQVVAGKRQYTQLMALFENWDMYNKNMSIATNAEGELQKMADVYAESWEAASARVRASWEGVWDSLLKDEAFIKMTNSLADVISGIEDVVDGLGGLGGSIAAIGSVFTAVFQNKISTAIDGVIQKFASFKASFGNAGLSGGAAFKSFFTQSTYQRNMIGTTNQMSKQFDVTNEMIQQQISKTTDPTARQTLEFEQQSNLLSQQLLRTKQELVKIEPQLNGLQKANAQAMISGLEDQIQKIEHYNQLRRNTIQILNQQRSAITNNDTAQTYYQRASGSNVPVSSTVAQGARDIEANRLIANGEIVGAEADSGFKGAIAAYEKLIAASERYNISTIKAKNAITDMKTATGSTEQVFQKSQQAILGLAQEHTKLAQAASKAGNVQQAEAFAKQATQLQQLAGTAKNSAELITGANQILTQSENAKSTAETQATQTRNTLTQSLEVSDDALQTVETETRQLIQAVLGLIAAQQQGTQATQNWHQKLMASTKGQKIAAGVQGLVSAFSQMSMAASAIANWDESSLTQKVTSIGGTIASLGMQIMSGPYGWVSALISLAGTAIGAVLGEMERREKELIEKQKIEREKLQKNVQDQQEEQKDKQTLMSQYNELYETYLRTGEGQDALKASAYELAEAYGVLGANLLIAQGNFSAFNAEIIKANNYGTRIANNTSLANEAIGLLGGNGSYDISDASTKVKVDSLGDLPDMYYDAISQGHGPRTVRQTVGYGTTARTESTLELFMNNDFIKQERKHVGGNYYNYAYSFNQDKIVPWLMSMVGNDEVLAKQLFAELFGAVFTKEATRKLAERSIETYDWSEILSSSWIAGGSLDDIYVDNRNAIKNFNSALENWQNVDSQILNTLYTGSSIATPNFSKHFINKNGSYVLDWNDLTGEEKYTRYWELQAAVGENGEYTQYLRELELKMKNIADASYGGDATLAAKNSQEYQDLQQEYNAVTKMIDTINKVLNNSEISTQVNLIKDLRTLNSQLQLEQTHLQNFLGKNEANSTFSEFTKNYSLMQQSIDSAMKDDATAYASLTEFMIEEVKDGKKTGKWIVDPNKQKEYEAARNALTESFIDTYTGFDDYMLMFQDIAATFDTTEITFNGEKTTVRQRVIDFISQAGIKTIEQFSAELLHAIEFIASSGNYDFENNALIKSIMASDAQRIKYTEASNKYTNFSNTAKTFKEDMDLAEAEAFYNAVDWGQDGIISWEEFLEKDYDDRLAYIESISDNYLETVKEEAETLKTTQEATLAQWEAVMNDAKYAKFKGTMGDYVDSSGQYDAVAIRKGFDTYIAGRGYTYNAEKGLYVSSTNANDTKTEQAFWNEYVATDADLAASGISLEALKGYISALEGASGSFVLIQQADGTIAALQLVGDQAESTATAFNRLAKSLSQLPTKQDDLQKIADVLSGGSIATLMNMTAEERAAAWASSLSTPVLHQSGVVEGQLPDKRGIRRITVDEGEAFSTNEDYIAYLEDWDNYNTAMSAILSAQSAIPLNNIENITSALDTLTESYEEFITTGEMSDKTKNALQMAGIDPNSIQSIDDYRNAIRRLETDQATQAESLKTIMTQYGDGLIDWSKMGKDVTWEEFLASQGDNIQVILEKFPQLAEYYEQWRQAAIEADDAGVNLDAIEAQIQLSQAAAASAAELERLKTAAEEAKTAVDQLNSAIGQTEPLSIEALTRLNQQGINGANWDGTGAGALSIYGKALSNSTMKQIEVLQHQMAGAQIAEGSNLWKAGTYRVQSQNLASMTSDELTTMLSHTGLSAPVIAEIQRMVEEAKAAGEELTWADILEGLQEYDGDLTEQMDVIWAQFEDSGVKAVQAILQAEQTAAQQTVQIWKTACQAILAAKQGIAEGKSIGESLMGSEGQMAAIIAIALGQGMTPEAIKTMLSGGDSQAWQNVVNAGPDFNAATYATAQGGQTQFLYNNNGVMAGNASELYTNASDVLGDHWENFLSQLTEAELAAYNAAKDKAQTEGVEFDGKQWLLDYLFPGWKNADGTFTSKATDDYNRSRGTVLEGEWTAEMKQARTELDAARTVFNRTYQEETANINDWKAIHDAAVTSQQTGQSIYDILGKDQAAGIMARLGLTQEQLNAQTVETATAAINASTANISAAQVTFETTSGQIENIELLGTARADALEEVNEQVTTTTNTYGNGAATRGYNDVWEYLDDHPELTGPEGMAQANAAWKTATRHDPSQGFDSITASVASMAKAYGMSTTAMEDYIRAVNNITNDNTTLTQTHLDVATAAMRQQAGIDMAAESLDGYIRTIKKGDTDSVDYIKSLDGMRNIYKELYNLTDAEAALLSDDFLTNAGNMALLQKAMAGDQEAWTQLQGNYNTAHATQITAGTLKTQNGALVGDTSAGDNKAFTNQIAKIQHEAQLLEQEMEALNSIDITEMPVKGTAAYEALSVALHEAGKSMSDYSKMSQKERAQALGNAKVANLREQKTKNAELIKAYEDQYNFENANYGWDDAVAAGLTKEYQAYLDAKQRELEINQEIADTRQATQDQINEIGAQDLEARLTALETEIEKVNELAEAYAEVADIMATAAETGELTATQIQKIKALDSETGKSYLQQWQNASTHAERVAVAAQVQADATQKSLTHQIDIHNGIARAKAWINKGEDSDTKFDDSIFGDEKAFKNMIEESGLEPYAQQALMDAYTAAASKMTSDSTMEDFYNQMEIELEALGEDSAAVMAEIRAEGTTAITELYSQLGEAEVALANQVVETWLNAFEQIAEARRALIMGEDIGDSLTASLESYITLAKAFTGTGSLAEAFKSGSLTADQLSLGSTGDLSEAIMDSMGLSSDNKGYNLFREVTGANGIKALALGSVNERAAELGITRMTNESDQAFNDRVNAQTSAFLENLLKQSGYDPTTAATIVQNALAGNATAIAQINEAANQMTDWTQEYTELLASETKIAEADAEFQATKEKQTEVQEQQQSYADITGKIMAIEGQRTTEGMRQILQEAGITEEEYLAAMREKGYDVTSLDQLVNMDLSGVHDQFVAGAQAAGQIIVDAAAAFMGIVTGEGYGEGSAAYEMAKKYKQEAETSLGLSQQDEEVKAHEAIINEAQQAGFESLEEQQQFIDLLVQKNELLSTSEMIQNGVVKTEAEALALQRKLANEYKKQATALKNFITSGKQWIKVLEDENSTIEDQADALMNLRNNYKNLLGLTDDQAALLGEDFLANAEMMELMEVAAEDAGEKGQEAFNKIQAAAATSMTMVDEAAAGLQTYVDQIASLDLEAGSLIPDGGGAEAVTAYWDGVVSAALAGGAGIEAAVAQANAAMEGLGVELTMQTVYVSATDYKQIGKITGSKYVRKGENGGFYVDDMQVYTEPTGEATIPITLPMASAKGNLISYKKAEAPGGGGKASSGGGGGGGGEPKKLDKKKRSDNNERYHETNKWLERIAENLEDIDVFTERAFGASKVKMIEREIEALEEEEKGLRRLLAETEVWLDYYGNKLTAEGATFDALGNIDNYDALVDGWLAQYNAFIDYYNACDAEMQKDLDEKKEEWDKWFEERMAWLEKYESDVAQKRKVQNDILTNENKRSDKHLEAIQYKVEYKMEINQGHIDLMEYFNSLWEDSIDKQDDRLQNLAEQSYLLEDNLHNLIAEKGELDAAFAAGNIDLNDYITGLQQVNEDMLQTLEEIENIREEIKELYGHTLDLINEAVDKQIAHIESATNAVSSYITILGLMGRGENYRELEQFYAASTDFAMKQALAEKEHLDLLKQEKAVFDERIAAGETLNEIEQQYYDDLMDHIDEGQEAFLSAVQATLEAIEAEYANTVNALIKELDAKLSGTAGSLAALSDQYAFYTEQKDWYVNSTTELYEMSKLNRKIEQSITDTSSKANKQMLKDLQARINAQSQLNQLTEYDIEMANLQYELALAKIALEEAQGAKDTVRLTRDESGNYIYQYTTDQDKIAEAQQNYEDILQNINDLALNRVAEIEQAIIDTQIWYKDRMAEILNDKTLTDEERMKALEELADQYHQKMEYYTEQYNNATNQAMISNDTIAEHYTNTLTGAATTLVESVTNANGEIVGNFVDTKDGINPVIAEMAAQPEVFKTAVEGAMEAAKTAINKYREKITEVETELGMSYADMEKALKDHEKTVNDSWGNIQKIIDSIKTEGLLQKIRDLGGAWGDYAETTLKKIIDQATGIIAENNKIIESMAAVRDAINTELPDTTDDEYNDAKEDVDPEKNDDDDTIPPGENPGGTGGDEGSDGGSDGNGEKDSSGSDRVYYGGYTNSGTFIGGYDCYADGESYAATLARGKGILVDKGSSHYRTSKNPVFAWWAKPKEKKYKYQPYGGMAWKEGFSSYAAAEADINSSSFTIPTAKPGQPGYESAIAAARQAAIRTITAYKTGGLADFTGPAWLDGTKEHPELVLNATDTQNMLTAVDTLRRLDSNAISILVASLNAATSSLFGALNQGYNNWNTINSNTSALEQNVHITAEFPNVQNRNEIEEAFNNLINRASQFVQRKHL